MFFLEVCLLLAVAALAQGDGHDGKFVCLLGRGTAEDC